MKAEGEKPENPKTEKPIHETEHQARSFEAAEFDEALFARSILPGDDAAKNLIVLGNLRFGRGFSPALSIRPAVPRFDEIGANLEHGGGQGLHLGFAPPERGSGFLMVRFEGAQSLTQGEEFAPVMTLG